MVRSAASRYTVHVLAVCGFLSAGLNGKEENTLVAIQFIMLHVHYACNHRDGNALTPYSTPKEDIRAWPGSNCFQ